MKKLIPLLFCLLIITQVMAQTDDIFLSQSLLLDLTMESDFTLEAESQDSQVDFVKAYFYFFPKESYYQDVINIETTPEAELNGEYYEFYWDNPIIRKHSFTVESEIKTYNRFMRVKKKIPFPIKIDDHELLQYIEPTKKIDITNDIIEQASELVEGEDDLFQVVFKLASWTKENIEYNLNTTTAEASQKASWVLENKYGVCDELTNLFIAMTRSLGIPARFVSGISYSNSELFEDAWGLHGWAEVYFPGYGWVSFDPTYGQYGYLDATHIKLRDSLDSDKSSSRFEWQTINVDLEPGQLDLDVNIRDQGNNIPKLINIEVVPLSSKVGFSSYNLIEAKLKNNQDYYLAFELIISKPKEVDVIDNKIKYVLLKPKEEKSVFWIVQVDNDLSWRYIYTFPTEIISSLGHSDEDTFRAESGSLTYSYSQITKLLNQLKEQELKVYSRNVEITCDLPTAVYVNENFNINCDVKNIGNVFLNSVRICLDDQQCQKHDIGISQIKNVGFSSILTEAAEQQLTVSAKNNDVNKIQQVKIMVEDKPQLTIEKVVYPELIDYGPDFDIDFQLWRHSLSKPKKLFVKFIINSKQTEWTLEELEANQKFNVKLDRTVLNPDENKFQIIVEYHDRNNLQYTESYEQFIELKEPGFFAKIELWLNKFSRNIEKVLFDITS